TGPQLEMSKARWVDPSRHLRPSFGVPCRWATNCPGEPAAAGWQFPPIPSRRRQEIPRQRRAAPLELCSSEDCPTSASPLCRDFAYGIHALLAGCKRDRLAYAKILFSLRKPPQRELGRIMKMRDLEAQTGLSG